MKEVSKKMLAVAVMVIWFCSMGAALSVAAPKIQFSQTVFDFGKTSQVATVSGVFKYKNVGDTILKIEPAKPSCGCTVAALDPDTLAPGATGELPFTLNLGSARATFEKHIAVRSNDPLTPEVLLTIKVDYTPLYDLNPMTLAPVLAFGVNGSTQYTTITRTDGKPLRIARMEASKPWIAATLESNTKAGEAATRIRIDIQRDGPPRRFNEYVHLYSPEQTNTPISSIYIYGQVMGEVSLSPEVLYWSITDPAVTTAAIPDSVITRRLTVRSVNGRPFDLKNPQSTIKGMKFEVLPKEAGKVYELVARLQDVPANTISGNVSFETSVVAQARIEVPIIVNVFKPNP